MVYSISGNKAIINGQNGIYDKQPIPSDIKYGRNAANNYKTYTEDLGRGQAPVQFAYQYIPQGKYSTLALMGNAYEELGKKTEVSVEEMNKKLDVYNQTLNADVKADALDLNGDGKIDIAEYATSTMAADMLDADPTKCDIRNLDGVITNKGEEASFVLYNKQNAEAAKGLFKAIHQTFNLDGAMKEFKSQQGA